MLPQKYNQRNRMSCFWSSSVVAALRSFQSSTMVVLVVIIIVLQSLSPVDSIPAPSSTAETVFAPLTKCFRVVCDLTVQYCDPDTKSCAECQNDCHPSRIRNEPGAEQECRTKCQWYYVFTSTMPPYATMTTVDPLLEDLQSRRFWDLVSDIGQLFVLALIPITIGALAIVVHRVFSEKNRRGFFANDVSKHGRPEDDDKLALVGGIKSEQTGVLERFALRKVGTSSSLPVECASSNLNPAISDQNQMDQNSSTEPLLNERVASTSASS